MADESLDETGTPRTAAERAAATIAAAAEAAAAEEAAAAAADEAHALLQEGAASPSGAAYPSGHADKQRLKLHRSVSPAAFGKKPLGQQQLEGLQQQKQQQERAAPSALKKAPSRACQWLRCLPVVFVMLLVLYLDVVYLAYHCLPQLQLRVPPHRRNFTKFHKGAVELLIFLLLTLLFLLSYWLAVATPAGSIPRTAEWQLGEHAGSGLHSKDTIETKRGGGRRACKWCCQRKPDRAHHCRVCRSCVLKMDHHCPWIFNCVGFGNHKFFMLTLLWGAALSVFVAVTMLPSVKAAIKNDEASLERVFMLLFAETLDIFLCTLTSGFLIFHSYLVAHAVTTIEFCEKQFRRSSLDAGPEVNWSRGLRRNFVDAFGSNPLLWFFPVDNREGDGTSFECRYPPKFEGTEDLERRLVKTLSASRRYRGFDPVVDSEA